jgi:hypothetical protein
VNLFHIPSMVDLVNDQDKITNPWMQLLTNLVNLLNRGYPAAVNSSQGIAVPQSVTIPLVKLTGGGANGSLTFTNGILTAAVAPT